MLCGAAQPPPPCHGWVGCGRQLWGCPWWLCREWGTPGSPHPIFLLLGVCNAALHLWATQGDSADGSVSVPLLESRADSVGNPRWEQLQCAAGARSCNLSFPCQAFSVCVIIAVIAAVVIAKEKGVRFKSKQPHGQEIVMCRKDALLLFSME